MMVYREKFMDLLMQVPKGVWLLAIGLSVQFSPVLVFRIKGGAVVSAIYVLGMILCASKYCRDGSMSAVSRAIRDNGGICLLLLIFYFMAIAAWFYAPYEIQYADIQHVWKKMLLNIFAIFIGLFLSRYPKFAKTIILFCIPCALFQAGIMDRTIASGGFEARYYLSEDRGGGGLGTFSQWEAIAILAVMLAGLSMTVRNNVVKIILGLLVIFFSATVLKAGYATPFALLLIGFAVMGVGFLRFGSSKKTNVTIKIGVAAFFLLGSMLVFFKIANSADSGNYVSESIAVRFANLLKDPTGGGYDAEHSRFKLMEIGWHSFCDSPLFGRGGEYPSPKYETAGGHHALVDYLGMYGIIGGGAYLLFVLLTMRNLFRRYKRTRDWFDCSKVAVSVMFFVGGVVNPGWMDLPMSCYLIFCAPFINRSENRISDCFNIPYPMPYPMPQERIVY